jgi:hypothetical protein
MTDMLRAEPNLLAGPMTAEEERIVREFFATKDHGPEPKNGGGGPDTFYGAARDLAERYTAHAK